MTPPTGQYWAGVDTHADTHTIALLDPLGRTIATATHPAGPDGYDALVAALGEPALCLGIGVEGTNSYGAGLTRRLLEAGFPVAEVLRPARTVRRRDGKSDPIDAVEAARALAAGQGGATPKGAAGWTEALRVLTVARDRLVESMTALSNSARSLLVTAPEAMRERHRNTPTPALMAALAALRPAGDVAGRALGEALRAQGRAWRRMEAQAGTLLESMTAILEAHARPLLDMAGVGPVTAARILAATGDPGRIHGQAALAKLFGACPIPASSGRTVRHRLNRGGNRQGNRALHQIAIVRLAHHQPTKDYADRRRGDGKTRAETIRCIKRHLVREVWQALKRIAAGQDAPAAPRGALLRELRTTHGITQQQLGHALGVASSRISEIETGKRHLPELEHQAIQHIHTITNTPTTPLDNL